MNVANKLLGEKSLLGIDIGASCFKMAQLKRKDGKVFLDRFGRMDTPDGALENGKVKDPEALAHRLRLVMKKQGIRGKQVLLSISNQNVVIRQIRFPKMTDRELKEAVKWEAEKHIMLPLEDALIDHVKLRDVQGESKDEMDVLLVAVARDVVNGYLDVFERLRLFPVVVDTEVFALFRLVKFLVGDEMMRGGSDHVQLVLDLGSDSTNLILLEEGKFVFTRNIASGGNSFTRAIMESEKVSKEEAEKMKSTSHILEMPEGQRVADELLKEIRRSLDYYLLYHSNNREKNMDHLLVTGGGVRQEGLLPFLGMGLKMEPKVVNPFDRIVADKRIDGIKEYASSFGVATGMALRGWV